MTLAQLRYIITVAGTGSMNEAAKELFISQPSLFQSVKELEAEIGVELFRRSNRGVSATQESIEFLDYARQVVEQYGVDEYEFAIRETKTYEVIGDVKSFRSEIGILFLNEFNEKVPGRLFRESELVFHPLMECEIYAYI